MFHNKKQEKKAKKLLKACKKIFKDERDYMGDISGYYIVLSGEKEVGLTVGHNIEGSVLVDGMDHIVRDSMTDMEKIAFFNGITDVISELSNKIEKNVDKNKPNKKTKSKTNKKGKKQ
jgi:hypothetical protein